MTYFEDLSAEWLLRGKGEMLHLPYKPKTIVENTLERKNNRVNLMELYKLTRPYIDKEKESGVETEEQSVSGLFYDIMHNMKEMSRNYQEMNKKQQEQIDKLLDIIRTEKSRKAGKDRSGADQYAENKPSGDNQDADCDKNFSYPAAGKSFRFDRAETGFGNPDCSSRGNSGIEEPAGGSQYAAYRNTAETDRAGNDAGGSPG